MGVYPNGGCTWNKSGHVETEGPSLFLDLLSSCHVFSSRHSSVVGDGISWILTYIGDSRKDLHHS